MLAEDLIKPKLQERSPHYWIGQKGKKKKESGQDLRPWEGAVKEEIFRHPRKPVHRQGDQPGQKGSFRGSEKSAAASLQRAKQRQTSTEGPCHLPALPSPRHALAGIRRGRGLKLGLQGTDPERGLGLAV